jgi:hypothetical protein
MELAASSDRLLCLDLSTNTGWAFFNSNKLISYGLIEVETPKINEPDRTYPGSWVIMALDMAHSISDVISDNNITHVLIEETNKSSRFTSRYSQKCLEYCHAFLNYVLITLHPEVRIQYIDTSMWRKILNFPAIKKLPEYIEKMPTGKTDYKWQSVILVNKLFKKEFKKKDNDICDAINLGLAWHVLNKIKLEF